MNTLDSIFSAPIPKIAELPKGTSEQIQEVTKKRLEFNPEDQKARAEQTIFIGNIPIGAKKQKIMSLFKDVGKIEKIWERSVPIDDQIHLSIKAKVITGKYAANAVNKNCYMLFSSKEEAQNAVKLKNGIEFEGRHLHVTMSNVTDKDFKTTVFVGNIDFNTDEEELRRYFEVLGSVDYVRLVREGLTGKSKGFAYVKFQSKESVKKAIELKNRIFKDRTLRIFKARKAILRSKLGGEDKQSHQNPAINAKIKKARSETGRNGKDGKRRQSK